MVPVSSKDIYRSCRPTTLVHTTLSTISVVFRERRRLLFALASSIHDTYVLTNHDGVRKGASANSVFNCALDLGLTANDHRYYPFSASCPTIMPKADLNKAGWEQSEFPILCETCASIDFLHSSCPSLAAGLGDNPFIRMVST